MSQAKVDRYKEEKRTEKKSWQKKKESVSQVTLPDVL